MTTTTTPGPYMAPCPGMTPTEQMHAALRLEAKRLAAPKAVVVRGALLWRVRDIGPRMGVRYIWAGRTADQGYPHPESVWYWTAREAAHAGTSAGAGGYGLR